MVKVVFFGLFGLLVVGCWFLAPWISGEPRHGLEEFAEQSKGKVSSSAPYRSSSPETSKMRPHPATTESFRANGPSMHRLASAEPPSSFANNLSSAIDSRAPLQRDSGTNQGARGEAFGEPSLPVNSVGSVPIAGGGYPIAPAREISIPVPEGAKVPALFYDGEPKPIPQQKALDRIAKEFEENVSEIPPGLTNEEVWETARAIADERYITLYGYQAFNQYHLQAAKEALREKKALQPRQGEPGN